MNRKITQTNKPRRSRDERGEGVISLAIEVIKQSCIAR